MKQSDTPINFVNNVYSNFHKILWNFYYKHINKWNDSMPIYKIFGEVLGIIIIIV